MESPLVSVIIPTYNGAKSIDNAVKSVLSQNYKNFEIIIVNDGSTDDTKAILKKKYGNIDNIYVLENKENLGFVRSLNAGIAKASGKYIARIDDDDQWIGEEKLLKQVDFLEKNPEYVLVGGGMIKIDSNGKEIKRYLFSESDAEIRKGLLADNLFAHSVVVYRKSSFEKAGGYVQEYGFFSDMDLWLKLGTIGKLYNFQEYFTAYLDKEINQSSYLTRDKQVRRRLFSRIKMAAQYRRKYRGFWKASSLCIISFLYSFLPFRNKIRRFLFKARDKFLSAPYK